jgi:hypothetical protein
VALLDEHIAGRLPNLAMASVDMAANHLSPGSTSNVACMQRSPPVLLQSRQRRGPCKRTAGELLCKMLSSQIPPTLPPLHQTGSHMQRATPPADSPRRQLPRRYTYTHPHSSPV